MVSGPLTGSDKRTLSFGGDDFDIQRFLAAFGDTNIE
jgi:hypothetical protein